MHEDDIKDAMQPRPWPGTFLRYEISRVGEFRSPPGELLHCEVIDVDDEPTEDEADGLVRIFWSLYGIPANGLAVCIGDYSAQSIAVAMLSGIVGRPLVGDLTKNRLWFDVHA